MTEKLKLAVLGCPIAHSRSPMLHELFAKHVGISEFSYERIETTCDTLEETVKSLIANGYDGFNCTMPLKTDMVKLSDEISDDARALCSVNTVHIKDSKTVSHTTDGEGILLAIRRGYGCFDRSAAQCVLGKRVLLLGAGGAARSAALSLKNAGAELTIVNRTLESAYALRDMLGSDFECLPLDESNAVCRAAKSSDILINCTAAGMSGKPEFKSLDFVDELPSHAMVLDAVYNPIETALLRRAKARGLLALSGLWMLIYQGAVAFEIWSGTMPNEDTCAAAFEFIK